MYLLINTSTPVCELYVYDDNRIIKNEKKDSGRDLARDLLGYIEYILKDVGLNISDLDGIGVFKGPGSFTGLRIGITVLNTIADSQAIAIVGSLGGTWVDDSIAKLKKGLDEKMILPVYGRDANITVSKK